MKRPLIAREALDKHLRVYSEHAVCPVYSKASLGLLLAEANKAMLTAAEIKQSEACVTTGKA
jgi:hypothetical protein